MSAKVLVEESALLKAWKLINTREWPIENMVALAEVHNEFTRATESPNENKSTNEDKP